MMFQTADNDCSAGAPARTTASTASAPPGDGEGFLELAWLAARQLDCPVAAIALLEGGRLRRVAAHGLAPGLATAVDALLRSVGPQRPTRVASDEREDATVLPFQAACALQDGNGQLHGVIAVADHVPRDVAAGAVLEPLGRIGALVSQLVGYREIRRRHHIVEQLANVDASLMLVFDPQGRVSFANLAAQVLLGQACDPGQPLHALFPPGLQPYPGAAARWLEGHADPGALAQAFDLHVRDAENDARMLEARRCAWHAGNESGLALSLTDVTDCPTRQNRAQSQLDRLTGLPNREGLMALLDDLRAAGTPITVALLGLDGFRALNDVLGHRIGDIVLQVVASRLMQWLPAHAHLARCGGDEFALVFPGMQPKAVEANLPTLLRGLSRACEIEFQRVHVDASIGLALDHAHEDGDETFARAGLALQHAKRAGHGQVRRFEPGMRTEAVDRRQLDLELRRAYRQGEFELHYQPQVDVRTGLPVGAEALLRWRHPERGLLGPMAFIDALAHSAIAPAVGRWIVETACREAASWPHAGGRALSVAVNLFPVQFEDDTLPQDIESILKDTGLPADRLELELTESIALRVDGSTEPGLAELSLARLRALGLRVSFDDFGTGHASLSMLYRLPVDRLKIDRSFVRDLVISRGSAAIVRSIVLIAQNFDMDVVAEGVEDEAQLSILRGLDCGLVQGYLYSPALPAAEWRRWLLANGADRATTPELPQAIDHG